MKAPRAGLALRELAERIDELPGYYVEVIEGALVVSPTPPKKHNGIARLLTRQVERQLPTGKVVHPVSSVEGDDDIDDYSSPDLIVVPVEQVLQSDPVDGVYQATHRMRFGDTVTLPEPLESLRIETADFPRHD